MDGFELEYIRYGSIVLIRSVWVRFWFGDQILVVSACVWIAFTLYKGSVSNLGVHGMLSLPFRSAE